MLPRVPPGGTLTLTLTLGLALILALSPSLSLSRWEELVEFIRVVAAAGVRHFIVHARKAILGLDTVKNRSVPQPHHSPSHSPLTTHHSPLNLQPHPQPSP